MRARGRRFALPAAPGAPRRPLRPSCPQVAPNFLSYLLLRFEIKRGASATVIGFVGGGRGSDRNCIRSSAANYYQEISAIVVLIVVTVSLIDIASERLRSRAMGFSPA